MVDDEVLLLQLAQFILEEAGFHVRVATGSQQALILLQSDMPEIILLDVMMPGMDGIELCRRIRADYPHLSPYIMMYSADSSQESRERGLSVGANLYLTKDISLYELPRLIHRHFQLNPKIASQ